MPQSARFRFAGLMIASGVDVSLPQSCWRFSSGIFAVVHICMRLPQSDGSTKNSCRKTVPFAELTKKALSCLEGQKDHNQKSRLCLARTVLYDLQSVTVSDVVLMYYLRRGTIQHWPKERSTVTLDIERVNRLDASLTISLRRRSSQACCVRAIIRFKT